MKFVKSGFGQKLIIILIVLMMFNVIMPKRVKAWDLAGILMKPITALICANLASMDVGIGVLLFAGQLGLDDLSNIIESVADDDGSASVETGDGSNIAAKDLLVGPDTIFSGKVDIFNANIFEATTSGSISDLVGMNMTGTIKKAVAQTYVILRNICAMLMLAALLFTGIRILASSNNPTKQAQWKSYLMDWLIGLALLIFSHIIMYGIFYVSDTLTNVLSLSMWGSGGINYELLKRCLKSFESSEQIILIIMLAYMIYLTVIFALAYFKRVLWVSLLIVIAPIVSVMYAFGPQTKSIYSKWIREYITTVLVQPFHMIVYSILISLPLNMVDGGGFTITSASIFKLVYALGAMAFIKPAEKYIRGLFGMDQGLANLASYDSGKKTLGAIIQTAAMFTPAGGVMKAAGAAKMALNTKNIGKTIGAVAKDVSGGKGDVGNALTKSTDPDPTMASPRNGGGPLGGDPILEKYSNDGFGRNNKGEYFNPNTDEYDPTYDPHNDKLYNPDYEPDEDKSTRKTDESGAKSSTTESSSSSTDNSSSSSAAERIEHAADKIEQAAEKMNSAAGNENNDEHVNIKNEGEETVVEDNRRTGTMIGNFMGVATGQQGFFETINKEPKTGVGRTLKTVATTPYRWLGKGIDQASEKLSEADEKKFGGKFKRNLGGKIGRGMEKVRNMPEFLDEFEKNGGIKELHKGFNTIRDTFYADGNGTGDWKNTNDRMEERFKRRQEEQKFYFQNNQDARQFFMAKYQAELRLSYPDKAKYPDERIKDMAKDKTNAKLKSLADTYVPLGVYNPIVAYECDEDSKERGILPEKAVANRIAYETFNINSSNVSYLNKQGIDCSSVSEAIPNANEYYKNGYDKVKDMALVEELRTALGVSTEKAIQLDTVLKRKGGEIDFDKKKLTAVQNDAMDKILDKYKNISEGK